MYRLVSATRTLLVFVAYLSAILAVWQYLVADRTVPYFAAVVDTCDGGQSTQALRRFLTDSAEGVALVDIIFNHDACEEDSLIVEASEFPRIVELDLGYDSRYRTAIDKIVDGHDYSTYDSPVWPALLRINDDLFDEDVLATSKFADGHGAHAVKGLVYVTSVGDEGENKFGFVPLRFDFRSEQVFRCTLALQNGSLSERLEREWDQTLRPSIRQPWEVEYPALGKAIAFLRTCVFA